VGGNSSFGGLSFAGSSVAENAVFINGLNVTDMYTRRGFSTAPFAFFNEFQVKTGGYSVEFGRSTGGVINAVTRSGSNEFKGGVEVTAEPSAWRSSAGDHFHRDGSAHSYGSRDNNSFLKTNVWGSGPIIKDKLFLFAMYEDRDDRAEQPQQPALEQCGVHGAGCRRVPVTESDDERVRRKRDEQQERNEQQHGVVRQSRPQQRHRSARNEACERGRD